MTRKDPKASGEALDRTPAVETVADPVADMVIALTGGGPDDEARRQARAEFSAIAESGRPWEQLPSGLKTAARVDAGRLAAAGGNAETLTAAGYSAAVATRLLRDIGKAA